MPCTNLNNVSAVVGLRVWYLFPKNKTIHALSLGTYFGCAIATIVLVKEQYPFILLEMSQGSQTSQSPVLLWVIYMPSLVVHTVFFFLKIVRLAMASEPVSETFLSLFFKE
ncbi:hypothetical protein CONPUDRAFT_62721 [Coniophora puteana RWD-64-598 SS2]|uniref:Uncharacterized protein n=1 Tax=Coniophora puteana (strain RWD-64-598) TaxID=741705 RepID=A0A5M3MDQ9_CONPW|nr:uncharacterized protein CONPUDRAFT_62721 [Coniophora puteana RWD-64-598 SS2]EIW77402.1 hypothetical protein CONPUDRAFT_62721 [Coniophora puteana RWD-64-598 SS2]